MGVGFGIYKKGFQKVVINDPASWFDEGHARAWTKPRRCLNEASGLTRSPIPLACTALGPVGAFYPATGFAGRGRHRTSLAATCRQPARQGQTSASLASDKIIAGCRCHCQRELVLGQQLLGYSARLGRVVEENSANAVERQTPRAVCVWSIDPSIPPRPQGSANTPDWPPPSDASRWPRWVSCEIFTHGAGGGSIIL